MTPTRTPPPLNVGGVTRRKDAMSTTSYPIALSRQARAFGICSLLDEAQMSLPADTLAELLIALRRALRSGGVGGGPDRPSPTIESMGSGLSQAARVYFRPIELLLQASDASGRPFDDAWIEDLDRYIDDVAARPRGAMVGSDAVR